ncbi:MAG: ABC transporter ATP-binding protein [Thermodesulfobacteriota bacterium]
MTNAVLLEIDGLRVFVRDLELLHGVSLHVDAHEIVAIIGPNGAGKSTLIRTIAGLHEPRTGSITFNGTRVDGLAPEKRAQLGITTIPEGARVFADMTVLDNLRMGSYIKQARSRRRETMEAVLGLFPILKERISQKAGTLSGGERQMLALGRALMSGPRLLLLDEPALGLAPIVVARVFDAVKEITRTGLTVLLVEQNVRQSLEIAHRGYVLENGCVALEGPADELIDNDHVKRLYLTL